MRLRYVVLWQSRRVANRRMRHSRGSWSLDDRRDGAKTLANVAEGRRKRQERFVRAAEAVACREDARRTQLSLTVAGMTFGVAVLGISSSQKAEDAGLFIRALDQRGSMAKG
jgi:hypothetical protein